VTPVVVFSLADMPKTTVLTGIPIIGAFMMLCVSSFLLFPIEVYFTIKLGGGFLRVSVLFVTIFI
ncbi:MAG TPA: hypothetical protein ACFYD4_11010, partial [Candidatus Wunengus sp. YC61]|uniref:hypothetical protein n=1 Tax=Candidatus Wunengus sp. YC61 TaxID=3367698 RepID=UPI004027A38F